MFIVSALLLDTHASRQGHWAMARSMEPCVLFSVVSFLSRVLWLSC